MSINVRTKLGLEEFALGMEQRGNYAAVKDARAKLSEEECAPGTEQVKLLLCDAATKEDAKIMSLKEECVGDTVAIESLSNRY